MGYNLTAKWTDSLYAYKLPSTGIWEDRSHERSIVFSDYWWRLKDKEWIDVAEKYFDKKKKEDDFLYDSGEDRVGGISDNRLDDFIAGSLKRTNERRMQKKNT